jgi:polysaccharide export outer membrane protein
MNFFDKLTKGEFSVNASREKRKFRDAFKLDAGALFLLTVMIFVSCALSAVAEEQKTGDNPAVYEIGVGDVLDVIVYEDPDLSRTVTVRSDGRISLPLIGEVMAAGLTPEALAKIVTEKLTKFADDPKVTVILAQGRERFYYILGQIEEPGQYAINQPITVLQAIARAGGFLEWAKKSRIMIVSAPGKPQKITYFNYENFLGGDDMGNVLINPGETIVVP